MQAGIKGFESKKNSFRKLHDEYIKLPETETKKIEKLYPAANIKQIAQVLARFAIKSATIPGIGAERKESLFLHGIRTALDINRAQLLAIPGIGEGLADDLLGWQESCLLDYRFNPNSPDMEIEKKVVRDKIIVRKNIIECELLAGCSSLQLYKKEALSNGDFFLPQLNTIVLKLAEAQGSLFIGKNIFLKISILLIMLVIITLLLFI
jgi:DNA-binding helix-hairpin-helix protein with protein kinase domain